MLGSERIFCLESRFNISFLWEKDTSVTQGIWQKKQFSICTQVQLVLVVKNLRTNAGDIRDTGSILGSGRPPGGGHSNPLQYSCLENSMDRGTWQATSMGVTKNET